MGKKIRIYLMKKALVGKERLIIYERKGIFCNKITEKWER